MNNYYQTNQKYPCDSQFSQKIFVIQVLSLEFIAKNNKQTDTVTEYSLHQSPETALTCISLSRLDKATLLPPGVRDIADIDL